MKHMGKPAFPSPEAQEAISARQHKAALGRWTVASALAFVAALLLWMRFGPTTFVDAVTTAWTCL